MSKDRRRKREFCFNEAGSVVKNGRRLADCGLMMAYDAEGTVMMVAGIFMAVNRRYEGGAQEQESKKNYEPPGYHGPIIVVQSRVVKTPSLNRTDGTL